MKNFKWNQEYEVNIPDIDFQHKFFLNLIKRLNDEFERKHSFINCKNIIDELIAYAKFHFKSEENFMEMCDYTGIENHKKEHKDILYKLSSITSNIYITESTDDSAYLIDFLLEWFVNHTTVVDQKFSQHWHMNKSIISI